MSFSSLAPMVTRAPSLAVGPHQHPGRRPPARANSGVRSASGSQTKLACEGGKVVAEAGQLGTDPSALGDHRVGACQQLIGGLQRGDRSGLRDGAGGERHVDLAQRGDHLRVTNGVANPQARPARRPSKTCAAQRHSDTGGPAPDCPAAGRRGCTRHRPRRCTTRMSEGTAATKRASSSGSTTVEVGLFGLHTKISRVRSVIGREPSRPGRRCGRAAAPAPASAPATRTCSGYTSKLRQPKITSSPAPQVIWISCWHRLTDPQPTAMCSGRDIAGRAEVAGQVLLEFDVAVVRIAVDGVGGGRDGGPHAGQRGRARSRCWPA